MTQRIYHNEWRKSNEDNHYPFSNAATMKSKDNRAVLDGVFLDAALYPIGGRERAYMSKVAVTHARVTISIGDTSRKVSCSGSFAIADPGDRVILADEFGRPAGVLISEPFRLGILQSWGVGTHELGIEASEFCSTCVIPTPEIGVRGIRLEDGEVLTGEVWLIGEDGIVLSVEDDSRSDVCGVVTRQTCIRVDVVGDPLFRRKLCVPTELFATPNFVKSVRVIHAGGEFVCTPDAFGELPISAGNDLVGDSVLRINSGPEGIVLSMAAKSSQQ